MPTIELTDEQAEELKNTLTDEIDRLGVELDHIGNPVDALPVEHSRSVLSDILELLEIA
jgi:hypothetical protein